MRNMILAVGPGTPAAICWRQSNHNQEEERGASSSGEDVLQDSSDDDDDDFADNVTSAFSDDNDHDDDDQDVAEDEEEETEAQVGECKGKDDNSEEKENSENEDSVGRQQQGEQAERRREMVRRRVLQILRRRRMLVEEPSDSNNSDNDDDDDEGSEMMFPLAAALHHPRPPCEEQQRPPWMPSMRHGGCINTACWLDCPWRLSTAGSAAPQSITESHETPTQLMTSGDDRLIKFWDVRNAMGMASPLPGGWDTFAPLAFGTDPNIGTPERHKAWKNHYQRSDAFKVAGSVNLLATLTSGHRGNVFHVTPIGGTPGKVLTCGADGYLRICDLHRETSAVVINPFAEEDSMDPYGGMAFSHQLMSKNTGLLCSERGLHHFDIRLSPREQHRQSLLKSHQNAYSISSSRNTTCKACAVWSPFRAPNDDTAEHTMVFAGGATEYVELLDFRMDGSRKKVLQRYKPRRLSNGNNLSVSGLDVSKDGRELLVSYESDQIYTFPVFHEAACPVGPSLDEIDTESAKFSENHQEFLPELVSYGGHLNRFTFLKNARYAGPNDEYIVTGSDSGKAWVYEKKSGCVVSLLNADSSTCNGVIPHPTLPFFITYGIDSTAKLWRAAPCVDPNVNDSPSARAKASLEVPYEMSPVTKSWAGVQALLKRFDDEHATMPDLFASAEEMTKTGRFASQAFPEISGVGSGRFGNSLQRLPPLLRQTQFECYRAHHEGRTVPIAQPLDMLSVHVSLNRLRLQATRLGLRVNPLVPWKFEGVKESHLCDIHPADLVPDCPSDWIRFDPQMKKNPLDAQIHFNWKDYGDVLRKTFPENSFIFDFSEEEGATSIPVPWLTDEQQGIGEETDKLTSLVGSNSIKFGLKSRQILYETAALCKEGGNRAVKQGLLHVAARRYDKAIQYCAVVFMQYPGKMTNLSNLTDGRCDEKVAAKNGDHVKPTSAISNWSPLLRTLIAARLNISLLMIKSDFAQPDRSSEQARAALKLLLPFTRQEGKVIVVRSRGGVKSEQVVADHEPAETYREAGALQGKAFFRLGSAEYEMGDYSAAIKSFELSLKSSSASSAHTKPDSLLIRRLQEAKRKRTQRKKRARKKFQKFMADPDVSNAADPGVDSS